MAHSLTFNTLLLNHHHQSLGSFASPSRSKRRISRVKPSRRTLFGGISLLGGFYVAQTISLSFGALGVNDVIAAVLCVLLTEYVTRFYYSRTTVTFPIALLNNFKMGFTYGLFIDAFKLAS
ncbi:hypothetical protein Rs2_43291 [Raphanus sativus]|nr:hypothetical protein Rs2_43291 [Raphanus sativus]